MNTIQRRAHLGLAISGPFSRNRRRSIFPVLLVTSLSAGLVAFLCALFL